MNLYEVLEVSPNASKEVITSAYRALARRYHPDANQDQNTKHFEEKMKQLNAAYEILSDEYKRAEYNLHLKRQAPPQPESQAKPRPEPKPGPQNQQQQTTYQRAETKPTAKPREKFHPPWTLIIFVVFIGLCIWGINYDDSPAASFDQPVVSEPSTGVISNYTGRTPMSPFEIKTADSDNDYYIKLAGVDSGTTAMTIFVRGGETVDVDVPEGIYIVKYATGDTWYGEDYLFGPDTRYSQTDETFDFTRDSGWTIELIPQTDGNLTETTLDASEF